MTEYGDDKKRADHCTLPIWGHNTVIGSFVYYDTTSYIICQAKGGKMKVKVIRAYIDKHTREFCGLDEILDYPKERAEELIKDGAVVKYKPTKAPEKATVHMDSIS